MTERGWGFSSSSEGSFSLGCWAALFCVFFTLKTSRRFIRTQLLDPLSTNSLYWARSENRDPTSTKTKKFRINEL